MTRNPMPAIALVSLALLATAPAASALTVRIEVSTESAHVYFACNVSMDLADIYNQLPSEWRAWWPLDSFTRTMKSAYDNLVAKLPEYRGQIEGAIEKGIKTFHPDLDIQNLSVKDFRIDLVDTKLTVRLVMEFDVRGVFYRTEDGRVGINLKWRSMRAGTDNLTGAPIDLTSFAPPLEQWSRENVGDRLKLSYSVTKIELDVSLPAPFTGAIRISIDPEMSILGSPGSAGASVSGDSMVLQQTWEERFGKPFLETPLGLATIAAVVMAVAGLALFFVRRRKGSGEA